MRVLLHSNVFAPDSVSTAYIMTALAHELIRHGHTVTVITTTPHYNADIDTLKGLSNTRWWGGLLYETHQDGVTVWHVRMPMKGQRLWGRLPDYVFFHIVSLLVSAMLVDAQDVVIATSPPLTMGVMSWLMSRWLGGAPVYRIAEMYPDVMIRRQVICNPILIAAAQWLERFVYARNRALVPISRQFGDVIVSRGIAAHKLAVIPDFIDTALYKPAPRNNAFAVEHALDREFVIMYAGNVGVMIDWESVLFAAERTARLPIRYVVVGDGAWRAWLERQIRERALSNVTLIPYQPQPRMADVNASCDIAMIPMSRAGAQDGFPSKIYAIMSCGKPVIASANSQSALASIINAAKCGRVVEPEDPEAFLAAVVAAYHAGTTLREEGARGREFVKREYTSEAIGRRYDALIRKLAVAS